MKYTYTRIENESGSFCIRAENGTGVVLLIPPDPANSDYQRYLEHLTENPTEDAE